MTVALPKWTARKPLSLSAVLKSLGMKRAFVAGEADRPFARAVVERGSGAVLFAGTVIDPR